MLKNDVKQVKACLFATLGIMAVENDLFTAGIVLWVWAICIFIQQAMLELRTGVRLINERGGK